uniref:Uncharacterized protein n=1 Tax=Alexandrium catenella TaxID=2925 RepID=A0A7S1PWG1_ALECA
MPCLPLRRPRGVPPAEGGGPHAEGEVLSQRAADVLSFISAGVDSGSLMRGGTRRLRAPPDHNFEVGTLGITSSFPSTSEPLKWARPFSRGTLADQDKPSWMPGSSSSSQLQYIQIPQHSLTDFRAFAKDVTRNASWEHATRNPYAVALRKHREELDKYTVVPVAKDETLEQRLGNQREALCQLEAADDDPAGAMWCRSEGSRLRPCVSSGGPSVACCAEDGNGGERPLVGLKAPGVYPLPIPGRSSSPTAAHSPLSARSFTSTTCSRPSVGDDHRGGQEKAGAHQCHERIEADELCSVTEKPHV